ncbi:cytochrome P450 [Nannocystis sp. SCPEA4]|uniref:cytochrome P450 n=1 Tax=Nannocystis sp. SCPEA4 TaxID=2996787 RepID=UPI00226D6129|nr:cytochrome P450 [Nannocystis sp. SCPEA4]MCY1059563.1 cytochrome P450 [Nannocystis sp. SCPEA4]
MKPLELRGLTPYGNLLHFLYDPAGFSAKVSATGDVVRVRLGADVPLFVRDPATIEQILVTKNRSFIKDRMTRDLAAVLGNGILVSDGEFWRRQRRLAQPAFHRERIAAYADEMVTAARGAVATWREGQAVDLYAEMMRLTREIVGATLFRGDAAREAEDVAGCLEVLMHRFSDWRFTMFPGLARLPLAVNRRHAAARDRLFARIDGIVAERRRSGEDHGDLLSMLMRARDEDDTGMTDAQLRDEVLILFVAGHETTALALSWAFVLLSGRPDAWAALTAEVDAVLGDRPATVDDLRRLVYTERVVLETMRLYPPAWSIGREAIEDVDLGDGLVVRRGEQVWILQLASHRDERHFPRPLAFEPERWENDLLRRLPRYAYFPFGGGPRLCIGNNFAMMEAVLVLATIAQRWRPAIAARDVPRPQFTITLRPGGPLRATMHGRGGAS